jgi:hypothetical protein
MIRYKSTSEFSAIVLRFRFAFSKRSWPYLLATAIPWLILSGQRSIRRLGKRASFRRHESSYYRFFSRFKFKPEMFFKMLMTLIVETFHLKNVLIATDDTLCPKWGKRIFGTAHFFDHVRRPRPGYIWGHNWVVLAVVAPIFNVPVALPFWIALYRPKKGCPPEEFRARLQIVAEALGTVRIWFPSLKIDLVADGAYNNQSLLKPIRKLDIHLVSRIRFDAVLRRDASTSRKGKRGRKSRYGEKIPPLKKIARSGKGWRVASVFIYGKTVTLRIKSFDVWWPKAGLKLRVVITRDPSNRRKPCYLSTTDLTLAPEEIIERFALRWPIEQLFSDVKLHVGLDSAEVRNPKSVLRHAILAFALVTWTRVWAAKTFAGQKNPPTTFFGQLTALRRHLLHSTIFSSIPQLKRSRRISKALADLIAA